MGSILKLIQSPPRSHYVNWVGRGARSAREHVLRAALGLVHPPCELIEPIGAMNVKLSEDV